MTLFSDFRYLNQSLKLSEFAPNFARFPAMTG